MITLNWILITERSLGNPEISAHWITHFQITNECPSIDKCVRKKWFVYSMDNYSALKK